jgi:beta-hydroxylase
MLLAVASQRGPFFKTDDLQWVNELEKNWVAIRDEMVAQVEQAQLPSLDQVSRGERSISDQRWKVFLFRFYMIDMEDNRQRCPATSRLIDRVPGMTSAMFSILEPGKHIPPHRGPFSGVLRYHLGLHIPNPPESTRIRVDNDTRFWQEGKSLLFDDTFEHEVWNDSDDYRAVLFLDVKRPLPIPVRWLNDLLLWLLATFIARHLIDKEVATVIGGK